MEGRFPAVAAEVSASRSRKDPTGQVKKPPKLLKGQQPLFNPSAKDQIIDDNKSGVLSQITSMVLMMVLYSARVARFDLMKAIQMLAKRITRWDAKCDRRLIRLFSYIKTTADWKMMGWIGDSPEVLSLHIFCDADFAGCLLKMHTMA